MSKNKNRRSSVVPSTDALVVETAIVESTPVAAVETTTATATAITLRDVVAGLPDAFVAPAYFAPMVDAIRRIAPMPTATTDERRAVCAAYTAAMDAAMPGTPEPRGRHTGRFTGMPVFETQNVIYLACAVANVVVNDGHVVAMWRAELPHARCDYIDRAYNRGYAWSTLSEYTRGAHNAVPGIPGAVDAVIAWTKRGRRPIGA